ncbi:MAG TPA: metal ABC transporter permease [bacterium]|nr:metal ABC transporter permease [bacterium]
MSIAHFLHYAFIQKAYLAGSFVAVLCAMLGLFLVLRKLSLIGDGLSHVSFGAIALGLFFGLYPFWVAIPVVLVAAFFILRLTQKARIYGDAAIGIVSSLGIAGGVILASLSRGFNVDLFSYLFGNILAVSTQEVYLSIGLSLVVFACVMLFYNDLFSVTFDEEYARITGIKAERINLVLVLLTAITVVLAIKVVGIMLVSALLILPAATALQVARGFRGAMFISVLCAVGSVLVGTTVSVFLNLPAGATIVMCGLLFFVIALTVRNLRR